VRVKHLKISDFREICTTKYSLVW